MNYKKILPLFFMLLFCMHTSCSDSSSSSSQSQQIPTLQELALKETKRYLLTKVDTDDEHYAEKVNKIFLHRDMIKGDAFTRFINNYINSNGEVIPFPTSEKSLRKKNSSILLHHVILNNNSQAMIGFLESGLSPNLNDDNNFIKNSRWNYPSRTHCCSLLTFAALCNADKIVQELINYGADIHANVNCISAHEEFDNQLYRHYMHCNLPIMHAALNLGYSCKIIKILIAAGADVNSRNEAGQTPLQQTNYIEIKALLRKAGAKCRHEIPGDPAYDLAKWV